jgi:hypothetical protein
MTLKPARALFSLSTHIYLMQLLHVIKNQKHNVEYVSVYLKKAGHLIYFSY